MPMGRWPPPRRRAPFLTPRVSTRIDRNDANEERHIDWIVEPIELVKQIGVQNDLAQGIRPEI